LISGRIRKLDLLPHERSHLWLLLLFSAVLFVPFLGARDFWAPVEPRYAEIARIMFVRNEWIVPTVNGQLYTDKPILYFWLVLAFSKIAGGVSEWTVRLPSALSGIGLVLTVYALGKELIRPRVGFFAGLICATSARVIWESRWAHIDMLFAFFFTLSLYFVSRAVLTRQRPGDWYAAYALMALATLTKGLIGVVLPGLILLAFVALRWEWRRLLEWRLFTGGALFLLIAAPWFSLIAAATGGEWLEKFIYLHHLQRYTDPLGHREPFYYYLVNFPADFLPWTVFLLPALFAHKKDFARLRQPLPLFLFLWFAAIFLFFSLSDSKRSLYLLPAFPPAALFAGRYFDRLIEGELSPTALHRWPAWAFFGALGLAGAVLPFAVWFFQRPWTALSLPLSLLLMGGAWTAAASVRRRLPFVTVLATALIVLSTMVYAAGWILPEVDRYKSPRFFASEVRKLVPPEEPLYIYADTMNDFNFYLERDTLPILSSPEEIEREISRNGGAYLLINERDLGRIAQRKHLTVLVRAQIGGKKWHLAFGPGER
jgi:4-amino-4-deoxy-L-arabinose transferase-like glycosyltransferase